MTAHNTHRKLFQTPANATQVAEICTSQCDPIKNPNGNCTQICYDVCPPDFCKSTSYYSSPSPQPPPLPLPPPFLDDGYILSTPSKHHHANLSLTLKISLGILVITFSLFLLYTLYKFYTIWYRSRRRHSPSSTTPENQETHDEFLDHDVLDHPIWYIRTIGLQPSVISAISVVKYDKSNGIVDGTHCSVCLSDFLDGETLRLLPKCSHAFHVMCIDTWLRSHTNCPLCRARIVNNSSGANSSSLDQNIDNLVGVEDAHVAVSIMEDVNEERLRDHGNDDDENVVGVGGSNIRRSVSLNAYDACRNRSDVHSTNNYYSDRHDIQIRSLDGGDLGFELRKVDQTENNCPTERE